MMRSRPVQAERTRTWNREAVCIRLTLARLLHDRCGLILCAER
jgi:hypothetical protein